MSEAGQFRTSINGFNKRDVLEYLDSLSAQEYEAEQHTQSLLDASREENAKLRQQLEQMAQRAAQAEEDTCTLQGAIDEYVQSAKERQAEQEELLSLRREKQMWRVKESSLMRSVAQLQQEIDELRGRLGTQENAEELRAQLEQARQSEAYALQSKERACQSEEHYRQMVETIGGFVEEMREIEQESLRICCGKSDRELQEIYGMLEAWEIQTAKDKERVLSLRRELREQVAKTDSRLAQIAQELDHAKTGGEPS